MCKPSGRRRRREILPTPHQNGIIGTLQLPAAAAYPVWNPAENHVYLPHPLTNAVSVIDAASDAIIETYQTGNQPYYVTLAAGNVASAPANRVITASADSFAVKTTPTVRAKNLDENAQVNRIPDRSSSKDASTLLARAEQEFNAKHYRESRLLYDEVAQADQKAIGADTAHKERWAYWLLARVDPYVARRQMQRLQSVK